MRQISPLKSFPTTSSRETKPSSSAFQQRRRHCPAAGASIRTTVSTPSPFSMTTRPGPAERSALRQTTPQPRPKACPSPCGSSPPPRPGRVRPLLSIGRFLPKAKPAPPPEQLPSATLHRREPSALTSPATAMPKTTSRSRSRSPTRTKAISSHWTRAPKPTP